MGEFVKREIERYEDSLNVTWFLHGSKPTPRLLVDDITQCKFERFGRNSFGQDMYFRIPLEQITTRINGEDTIGGRR
jgi:hypothetical protein